MPILKNKTKVIEIQETIYLCKLCNKYFNNFNLALNCEESHFEKVKLTFLRNKGISLDIKNFSFTNIFSLEFIYENEKFCLSFSKSKKNYNLRNQDYYDGSAHDIIKFVYEQIFTFNNIKNYEIFKNINEYCETIINYYIKNSTYNEFKLNEKYFPELKDLCLIKYINEDDKD